MTELALLRAKVRDVCALIMCADFTRRARPGRGFLEDESNVATSELLKLASELGFLSVGQPLVRVRWMASPVPDTVRVAMFWATTALYCAEKLW